MMKRFTVYLLASIIVATLISSCALNILPGDELSESEKMQVIDRAREFISDSKANISNDDKIFVKSNMPKFHVTYVGYKRGVAKIFWRINPSYSIRIIYNGNLLDADCPARMSITRFKL